NSYTGDVAIDLIEVSSCISCPSPLPSSLSVNSISSDSVNLSWQGSANQSTWLVYLVSDTSTLSNTVPTLVTNDTINLAVNPNLNYSFYVKGICSGGDTSVLAGPVSFSTPCVSFTTFPYLEEFNTWPPNCWDLSGGTQTCVHFNGTSAEASFWSWSAGEFAYMTSPVFDVSNMASPELLFDWSHQYNSFYPNDALEVLVSSDGGINWTQIWYKTATDLESNDGATTSSPGTFTNSGRITLSPFGNSILVRFNFASGWGPDCFIDNVEIKEAPQNDLGVVVADLPNAVSGCEVDSSLVTATIFNFGYLPQTAFNVQYSLNGTPTVETVFDTLQPGDSLLYTFNLAVDLTQDGSYSFDFTTNLTNDDDTSNDAYESTLTYENYYTPFAPTVTDDTVCVNAFFPNGDIATLTASGPSGVDFDWFDDMGNFIGTGDTMTSDTISSSTSVYVAYKELAPGNIGAANTNFGGGGYYNFFTEGLMFDVFNDMTIDSVTIYPSDTGTIGIIIQSLLGSTVYNGSYTITAPVNTISGHKVPLGVNIPAGYAYGMYISSISPGTLSLYRNTTNASYPYNYSNIASITQPSNGLTDFYFFFYNWDISTISCYSDMQEATIHVDNCAGINNEPVKDFYISPNPNNGEFELNLSYIGENTTLEILDLNGKLIYRSKLDHKNQSININSISRGVYLMSLIENGNKKTKKLIIK
ncbi:MAG: T9SS C-terminal target domain-containing protein, partial [Crocinitomicaceae bacterium TMED135]